MNRSICVHGHFYQPPRENPWLEEVELQDSAYPYHDWNARVTAECYAPNAASRILDQQRRIIDIVNNYARISFNFGPTLLSWMKLHEPEVYHAVINADKVSRKQFSGHGAALAQCYNHMIMPLASPRDKRTQVVWGIRDFESRFNRKPEGMWLPETAVDLETLDILAECGIQFTILAPGQAQRIRKVGEKKWQDVSSERVNTRRPYICNLKSGRAIRIFFYDGPIAHDIAFGDLLSNGEGLYARCKESFPAEDAQAQLIHMATDGETYGHHHRFGEMALAYCLYLIESSGDMRLTVYGEYLEQHPAQWEVEIFERSSWSCFHGVERWQSDCGCNSGQDRPWHQQWRAPLREALDWLRDNVAHIFEEQSQGLLREPWKVRDAYIRLILDRSETNAESFFKEYAVKELSPDEKIKVLQLLEMQRHAMLMFTSCGWFFDEISGIETVQVMQYAARVIQLARAVSSVSLEEAFMRLLERAPSNIPEYKDGKGVYEQLILPHILDPLRVGVHYAVSSLFREYEETAQIYSFTARSLSFEVVEIGKQRMALGVVHVRSRITREEETLNFTVLHFGDQNLIGAAKKYTDEDAVRRMKEAFKEAFGKGQIPEMVRLVEEHFNHTGYSLWHLFKDEQRAVVRRLLTAAVEETNTQFRQLFEHHAGVMQAVDILKIPPPRVFASVAEFVLNTDIREAVEKEDVDREKLQAAVSQIKKYSLSLDRPTINYVVSTKINDLMVRFAKQPHDHALLAAAVAVLGSVNALALELNLWKAQNIYFSLSKHKHPDQWGEDFLKLGEYLKVKV